MKQVITLIILALSLHACITISGLYDGYRNLYSSNKEKVVRWAELDQTQKGSDDLIILVSDTELLQIMRQDTATYQMVYEFTPSCSSEYCVPITAFTAICKEYGITPFVVTRYLDNSLFTMKHDARPLYGMDPKIYGTRLVYKYADRFISGLTQGGSNEDMGENVFLFKDGKFVRSIDILKYKEELSPEHIDRQRQ